MGRDRASSAAVQAEDGAFSASPPQELAPEAPVDRVTQCEALIATAAKRERRLVVILADTIARLQCAEMSFGFRGRAVNERPHWINIGYDAYDSIRDELREKIEAELGK